MYYPETTSLGASGAPHDNGRASPASPSNTSTSKPWQSCSLECVEEDREVFFDAGDGLTSPRNVLHDATGSRSSGLVRGLSAPTAAPQPSLTGMQLKPLQSSSPFSFVPPFAEPATSSLDLCSSSNGSEGRMQRNSQAAAAATQRSSSLAWPQPTLSSGLTSCLAAAATCAPIDLKQYQRKQTDNFSAPILFCPSSYHSASLLPIAPSSRLFRSASATDIYNVPERRVHAGRHAGQPLSKQQEGKIRGGLAHSHGSKHDMTLGSAASLGSNCSPSNALLGAVGVFAVRSSSCLPDNTSIASDMGYYRSASGLVSGSVGRPSIAGSMDDCKVRNGVLASIGTDGRVHGGLTRRSSKSSFMDVVSHGGQPGSARSSITNSYGINSTLLPTGSYSQARALAGSVDFAESLLSSFTRAGSGLGDFGNADGIDDAAWAAMFPLAYDPHSPPPRLPDPAERETAGTLAVPKSNGGSSTVYYDVDGSTSRSQLLEDEDVTLGPGDKVAMLHDKAASGGTELMNITRIATKRSPVVMGTQDDGSGSSQHMGSSGATACATLSSSAALDLSRAASLEVMPVAVTVIPGIAGDAAPQVQALAKSPSLGVIYKVHRCSSSNLTAAGQPQGSVAYGGSAASAAGWSWCGSLDLGTVATRPKYASASYSTGASPMTTGMSCDTGRAFMQQQQLSPQHLQHPTATLLPGSPNSFNAVFSRRPSLLEYAETVANVHQNEHALSRGTSSNMQQRQSHSGMTRGMIRGSHASGGQLSRGSQSGSQSLQPGTGNATGSQSGLAVA